jgi:lipopolysaccharide/colanic/teichoic acid biosynthesis glycosyltransferase
VTGRSTTTLRPAALIVTVYVAFMPFLAGLPRGSILPFLRPSEALQLVATVMAAALLVPCLARDEVWHVKLRQSEWWLLAVAIAASIMPLLWLLARAEPIGLDEILAAFPFVKFAALYFLVRASVGSTTDARAVLMAAAGGGVVVAGAAISQSLGIGPVIDFLGQYYTEEGTVALDEGRGSATIGSSIAAGAYLAVGAMMTLSMGLATRRARWFAISTILATGSLASGQASVVLALALGLLVVGALHGRAKLIIGWSVPATVVAIVGLWPIVSARLADIDQGTGLPSSWVVRWVNVTELYWPTLADNGWILGVSPEARQTPPDLWRDVVYLESGYLWLLWVGGIPLLAAALMFLRSAYRDLGAARTDATPTINALTAASQATIIMFALLSVLDPHLTLRASADLFFVLLAIAAATVPFATRRPAPHRRWRELLGADHPVAAGHSDARVQLSEAPAASLAPGMGGTVEAVLDVGVRQPTKRTASARLALVRRNSALHGIVIDPTADSADGTALLWRGIARCAGSLRLASLAFEGGNETVVVQRRELKRAAALAEELEVERARNQPDRTDYQRAETPFRRHEAKPLPVRLEVAVRPPVWKRLTDLTLAALAAILTAPLAAVCAVLVRRSGRGPIIFRQLRLGTGGLPFQMLKFRTMHIGNDDTDHRTQNRLELLGLAEGEKSSSDSRITPIGKWLRKTSLDELPQLVNVLRGEMSIVGPRPSLLWETELFTPPSRRRLTTTPGITGLWQTQGRADVSMLEMLELDLRYIDTRSPSVDFRCITATARSVVEGQGAA